MLSELSQLFHVTVSAYFSALPSKTVNIRTTDNGEAGVVLIWGYHGFGI
jgi:hypothetical protein